MIKEATNYKRSSYTITDFYLKYKQEIDLDTIYDVDMKTYRAIVLDYFKYIRDEIIQNCKEFKFPYRLGTLQVIKHMPKTFTNQSLRWDWKATKETGKPVYLLNEHSDYWKFRFHWSKKNCLLTNKSKYQFIASRRNKRDLAKIIFQGVNDYPEL